METTSADTEAVLHVLTANPALWAKTALFVTWDENGGFFDHVPPPVAPAGTAFDPVVIKITLKDISGTVLGDVGSLAIDHAEQPMLHLDRIIRP